MNTSIVKSNACYANIIQYISIFLFRSSKSIAAHIKKDGEIYQKSRKKDKKPQSENPKAPQTESQLEKKIVCHEVAKDYVLDKPRV